MKLFSLSLGNNPKLGLNYLFILKAHLPVSTGCLFDSVLPLGSKSSPTSVDDRKSIMIVFVYK